MKKPLDVLKASLNSNVIVELRSGRQYRGVLDGYDIYMNVVLKKAEEFINGESVGRLGTTIVRGDNIIYVSP
ncbi:MAG: small nuclear ribonucleoprotein [Thermoplasmatales archaeon]|nr:small nuclear ribonucleoprotein [Thermoplasmatales archaeon]